MVSINDGISMEWLFISYVSIDYLLSLVLRMDKRVLLVKANIKEAYRILTIHPDD